MLPPLPLDVDGGRVAPPSAVLDTCQNATRPERQDFPTESMIDSNSAADCLHLVASGVLARSASSARSMALSTVCQSAAARGFKAASASSHWVSRSLIRILAPARSPLSI